MKMITNLVQLRHFAPAVLAAVMLLTAEAANAQPADLSQVQIKTADLGHMTYMLEGGRGGNIVLAVGTTASLWWTASLRRSTTRSRPPSRRCRASPSVISSTSISTASRPAATSFFTRTAPPSWRSTMSERV
jgi:hypothetical protein